MGTSQNPMAPSILLEGPINKETVQGILEKVIDYNQLCDHSGCVPSYRGIITFSLTVELIFSIEQGQLVSGQILILHTPI